MMGDGMQEIPTLEGVRAERITTSRLATRVLFTGPDDGVPVLFLHGNLASATWWEETMLALPSRYRGIAPDLRSYGGSQMDRKIDATRGVCDLSDDAFVLMDHLGHERFHVAGHSFGSAVVWQMMIDHPERLLTVTHAAPGSPYGFGGTKGLDGELCWPDGAGSGAGLVNPMLVQALQQGDRSADQPYSPRAMMNALFWKPPFRSAREEALLSSMLAQHLGEQDYPGDFAASPNWPGFAPGQFGQANAISPIYQGDVLALTRIEPKPPVLWVRGADDTLVSDAALGDRGTLGKMGVVPGWPGEDVFPPQPMVGQTRRVLEQYAENGGMYQEVVFEACGHSPFIEKPEAFNKALHEHLRAG